MDGITDLTCKDGTAHHLVDGWEPTHNRKVSRRLARRRRQPCRWLREGGDPGAGVISAGRSPWKPGLVGVRARLAVAIPPQVEVQAQDDADGQPNQPQTIVRPNEEGALSNRVNSTAEPTLAPRAAQSIRCKDPVIAPAPAP
jgi:hypothetical protein